MAYTDPQSVTVNAVATTYPRVLTGSTVGRFVAPDGASELTIDPRGTAKRRRNVSRFYTKRTATDPGTGLTTTVQDMSSFTIDRGLSGATDQQILDSALGHIKWLTDNTNANLKKLIAGEN
jgi:hypothetical protein